MTLQNLWGLAVVQSKSVFLNNVNFMNDNDMDNAKRKLERLWNVVNEPMKDFIAQTELTPANFSTQNCISARTVQHWVAGERACPTYARFAYARLYNLIDMTYFEDALK